MGIEQRFNSLEDFLASTELSVDGVLNDGAGMPYPVKGREIEATVLFADIARFSTRTGDMSPVETLAFVQQFFAWITGEALHGRPGIVDKYIGDEVMVVFSKEFGSEDPFADAVRAGGYMSKNDIHRYHPHIGIASGPVVVGYAGTPLRYNVSVFGAPVALAARLAGVRGTGEHFVSSTVVFPAEEWGGRDLDEVIPPITYGDDGFGHDFPPLQKFELRPERTEELKGLGETRIREIFNGGDYFHQEYTVEGRTVEEVVRLKQRGRYQPRWGSTKPGG